MVIKSNAKNVAASGWKNFFLNLSAAEQNRAP
jgi:hypothetical protein